jgi:hypothetical protein
VRRATALHIDEAAVHRAEIDQWRARIEARVEALEAQRGVRDAWERAVLPAIAAAIGGRRS